MGYITKAGRAVIEAFGGRVAFGVAPGGQSSLSRRRELVEILVLKHFIARDVEAGRVGEVEHIEGVLQVESFGDAGHFDQ